MLAAPLMIGCDITTMDDKTLEIISNPELIAIDQDQLGKQGIREYRNDGIEYWKKELSGNRVAVAILNRSERKCHVDLQWDALELDPDQSYDVRNAVEHCDLGCHCKQISIDVERHVCSVLVMNPVS